MLEQIRTRISLADASLKNLGHAAVLARGYSLTMNVRGEIVRNASKVTQGERIVTTLAVGEIESQVLKKASR